MSIKNPISTSHNNVNLMYFPSIKNTFEPDQKLTLNYTKYSNFDP